ncbi:DeoR/GlpR family DNA-binding transcription regulator [Bacillus suaedae]|uniref:DeoR/GlpR transcriptional regulator n=1 Tax=Halalkalibacter suaedae TaxID=2822140 RepID=A0A941ARU0_9BACI|nr:DeoR/GlpR family DNA-binding transcription regulator [Bacillus suaedae]MBP3953248.1 DeoR/GlpR transcriptional regulator [Bacillus suaedae]
MLVQERYDRIIEMLEDAHSVKVQEFVDEFRVSAETVRRDLEYLESIGKLKRVHGGAILERDNSQEQSFTTRETLHSDEKIEIANLAMQFVQEEQVIALDVSTTNTEIAKALKQRFRKLTIITNSLPIVLELSTMPQYTIILSGGTLRNEELCVVGELAESFLSQFHISLFFMSMSGISLHAGLTDYGIGEWNIKKKMMQQAKSVYVVADSSKFDAVSMLKVCSFDKIEAIITDSKLPSKVKDNYIQNNIKIINE